MTLGWGGMYNGYFYCSNLNPGSYNFTSSQLATIKVQPLQITSVISENPGKENVVLFPNIISISAILEINSPGFIQGLLSIYNVTGKLLRQEKITGNKHIIEKGDLSRGMYFFQVMDAEKQIATGKLIIK